MEHNKKINRSGAITLPMALRREYGFDAGTKLSIEVSPTTGNIVMKKATTTCFFCKSADNDTITYMGRQICEECVENIYGGISSAERN